jgi:uncharacterized protein
MSGLRIDVADLLTHPGSRRDLMLEEAVEGLTGSAVTVVGPVQLCLGLDRIPDGIVVRGTVTARWQGECSRCLRELAHDLQLAVDELFEPEALEGETYPIEGHEIDLSQLVRDTVLLELPLAPVCSDECGPVPTDETEEPPVDPRWAVLSELEL